MNPAFLINLVDLTKTRCIREKARKLFFMYIYIYMYIGEREREREREKKSVYN